MTIYPWYEVTLETELVPQRLGLGGLPYDLEKERPETWKAARRIVGVSGDGKERVVLKDVPSRWQADVIDELKQQKDGAYKERNQLVAALARVTQALGGTVWLGKHQSDPRETESNPWDPEWMNIIFIELPNGGGQLSWHLHDSDVSMFDWVENAEIGAWDGHSTEEKYQRVRLMNWDRVVSKRTVELSEQRLKTAIWNEGSDE